MSELTHADSVTIARPPAEVYDLVADVTRMGEWSPVCRACWWEDDGGLRVGAWFVGRNERPGRTWETRSVVEVADPGREFTFAVRGSWVRWSYTLEPVDAGTLLTETWTFLPDGIAGFHELFGADAQKQIDDRVRMAHEGIAATLAAIKRTAEAS